MTTSNGQLRPTGPLFNSTDRRFSSPPPAGSSPPKWIRKEPAQQEDIGERNQNTTLFGAMTHKYYVDKHADRDSAARKLGLLKGKYEPTPEIAPSAGSFTPTHITDEAIAQAGEGLPKGNAIVIELQQEGSGPGHAIAFYNSRGGTLYFFDPNAGVYEIFWPLSEHLLAFVRAWLRVYRDATPTPVTWKPSWSADAPEGWYGVYNRAGDGNAAGKDSAVTYSSRAIQGITVSECAER